MYQEKKIFGKRQGEERIILKWTAENTVMIFSGFTWFKDRLS
jgi:hypothetical protein